MKIAILVANGFEEIETSVVYDVLKRADIDVLTVSLEPGEVTGSRGLKIISDTTIDNLDIPSLDGVVVPGGYPGYVNLGNSAAVLDMLKQMASDGKYIASICAGPLVLEQAGVIRGKRVTCFPGMEGELKTPHLVFQRVVEDGNVITSQGPGTAMEFALKLVESWVNKDTADRLSEEMVV